MPTEEKVVWGFQSIADFDDRLNITKDELLAYVFTEARRAFLTQWQKEGFKLEGPHVFRFDIRSVPPLFKEDDDN